MEPGGEARQPLGLVVVGGLLFSQLVTLYLTPVVFTYMAQVQHWLQTRRSDVGSAVPAPAKS
jgi:HAE1 family hydrophobic/amphiphilic exporter-1